MAKTDAADAVKESLKPAKQSAGKNIVTITNRDNAPYDLTLISIGICQRLEPRGKTGDSINIPVEWTKHKDFESAKQYLVVTE
jgi:hypothetical protein